MPTATLAIFIAFALLLLALAWASRTIGLLIQEIVFRLTGSGDMAMVILFLAYLPGIFIHEGAHWLMAKLLGLKTGKFRVWPQKKGKYIGMGSVTVNRGGTVRDSLVGLAPLLAGSAWVAFIASQIFGADRLAGVWAQSNLLGVVVSIFEALGGQQDGLVWAWAIFAIANAMMPSASDREPLKMLVLYLVIVGSLYILLDSSGQLFLQAAVWLAGPIRLLVSALIFTLVIDGVILALLYGVRVIIAGLQRR
ncbi:MAG: hypothetical protein DWI57_08120 [Chloroflexi bacterium]|nr:MAG: hypothetical protein DWI57_08120 [Chloroflexota bacterium]